MGIYGLEVMSTLDIFTLHVCLLRWDVLTRLGSLKLPYSVVSHSASQPNAECVNKTRKPNAGGMLYLWVALLISYVGFILFFIFSFFLTKSLYHNPKLHVFACVYIKITAAVSFFKISEKPIPACQRKQALYYLHWWDRFTMWVKKWKWKRGC